MATVSARYFNPLRLAAYVLALYFLGHTVGALVLTPQFGPEGDAVLTQMKSVRFACETFECSWFGFYLGFGWFASIFLLLSAALAWFVGGMDAREQRAVSPIVWLLFFGHAAGVVLAWKYFFLTPLIFSTLAAALLGFQCVRLARPHASEATLAR